MGSYHVRMLDGAKVCLSSLLLWIILIVAGAPQAGAGACITAEQAVRYERQHFGVGPLADFSDTAAFLERFNAAPPPSQIAADRIMIFRRPGERDLVLFFLDGCQFEYAAPKRYFTDWLLSSFGLRT